MVYTQTKQPTGLCGQSEKPQPPRRNETDAHVTMFRLPRKQFLQALAFCSINDDFIAIQPISKLCYEYLCL